MVSEKTDITGQIEGCKFPQWYLEQGNEHGVWTPEEVATVEAVLRKHIQDYYDKGYGYATNYWRVWKIYFPEHTIHQMSFTAIKATWEYGALGGKSAEEVATAIEGYYTKNS